MATGPSGTQGTPPPAHDPPTTAHDPPTTAPTNPFTAQQLTWLDARLQAATKPPATSASGKQDY